MSAWTRFWFSRAPSDSLALVRLFLGLSCVLKLTGLYGVVNRMAIGKLAFGAPLHRYTSGSWRFDDIPVPLFGERTTALLTFEDYQHLEAAALVLGALFCLGLGSRLVGPLLGASLLLMQTFDQAAFKHHLWTLGVACLVVGLAPCADRFSLDALLARRLGARFGRGAERAGARVMRSVLPLRLIQTMVTAIYLFSTVAKLNDTWFSGFLFRFGLMRSPKSEMVETMAAGGALLDLLWVSLSWAALAIEAFLVFGLWHPRWRKLAFATGLVFHVSLEIAIDVGSYSSTMLALYLAFAAPAARATTVRFDPTRAASRRAAWLVRVLDWGARFAVVPGSIEGGVLEAHGSEGWKHTGARAIATILGGLPLLLPFGLLAEQVLIRRRRR
jgi:hypothetical protein